MKKLELTKEEKIEYENLKKEYNSWMDGTIMPTLEDTCRWVDKTMEIHKKLYKQKNNNK